MSGTDRWVLLAYRLPREPSSPRIAIWRKLKRLGVAKLGDGLVGLPLDSRNQEQLEWVSEEIAEARGEASLWLASALTASQHRRVAAEMTKAIAEQYRQVAAEARIAAGVTAKRRRRTLLRLRRELGRIRRRDYFPPPERAEAHRAVEALADAIDEVAA